MKMQAGLPFHGDEVSEPLVRHLVVDDDGDPLFAGRGRVGRVHQDAALPVGDKAPVLHGAALKVGDGDALVLKC